MAEPEEPILPSPRLTASDISSASSFTPINTEIQVFHTEQPIVLINLSKSKFFLTSIIEAQLYIFREGFFFKVTCQ